MLTNLMFEPGDEMETPAYWEAIFDELVRKRQTQWEGVAKSYDVRREHYTAITNAWETVCAKYQALRFKVHRYSEGDRLRVHVDYHRESPRHSKTKEQWIDVFKEYIDVDFLILGRVFYIEEDDQVQQKIDLLLDAWSTASRGYSCYKSEHRSSKPFGDSTTLLFFYAWHTSASIGAPYGKFKVE